MPAFFLRCCEIAGSGLGAPKADVLMLYVPGPGTLCSRDQKKLSKQKVCNKVGLRSVMR